MTYPKEIIPVGRCVVRKSVTWEESRPREDIMLHPDIGLLAFRSQNTHLRFHLVGVADTFLLSKKLSKNKD